MLQATNACSSFPIRSVPHGRADVVDIRVRWIGGDRFTEAPTLWSCALGRQFVADVSMVGLSIRDISSIDRSEDSCGDAGHCPGEHL